MVRDLRSEVRRDWIQLIGRNLAHTTAGKGRARRMPLVKRGSPRKLELRQNHPQSHNTRQSVGRSQNHQDDL